MNHSATDTDSNGSDRQRVVPPSTHRAKHASAAGPVRLAWPSGARRPAGARRASATLNAVVSRTVLVLGLAVLLLAAQLKAPPHNRAAQEGNPPRVGGALSAAPGAGTSFLLPQPSSVDGPAAPVGTRAPADSSPPPSRGPSAGRVNARPGTSVSSAPQSVLTSPYTPSQGAHASSSGPRPSSDRTSPASSGVPPLPSPPRYYLINSYFSGERASACLAPVGARAGAQVVQRACSGGASLWTRTIEGDGRLSLHFSASLCLGLPDGLVQYASPLVLVPCGSTAEPRWVIDTQAYRVYVSEPGGASPRWCVTGYDGASESGTFDDLLFPCSHDALNQDVTLLPAQH